MFVIVCGYNAICPSEGQGDFRLSRLGSLLGFLVHSFIDDDPNMIWDPLQSVGVLLLKSKVADWESMKKTTFAGVRPADSKCIVVSQTAKTLPL
ncbi:hypothetical protein TNCV_4719461 [Trichonephila clavipes]|uniref:Uncharacterized protein n=1 Tax=Trichonephila clavipes TaxID=2585209 RepID=A0A8X6W6X0_TRICX|nr:hypothetical protein TNCV_4719461 [Trichonephila clavipes]